VDLFVLKKLEELRENWEVLVQATDQTGRSLVVSTIVKSKER
jgi:hypothetical protein